MTVFKFDKDVVTKKECIAFNRKGVKFIKKISGKGEKFLEGEFINDFEFNIDTKKKGVVFEVCFTDKIKIVIKDEEKEVLRKSYFYIDYEDKTINEISAQKVFGIFKPSEDGDDSEMMMYQ